VSYADVESVFREKRYQEAAALFTRYTEQRPNSSWGHYMRGVSAWKDGDLTQAEEAFGHALLLDPDHVKSLLNLSRVLLEQERFDEALEKTELAREINSTSNAVHRLLARSYYAQGRVDDAVDTYRHAIILDDLDAWSMNNLGLIFFEQRRFEEALPPLARAVELREDVPQFQNNLGMVLEHTGRFVDAAKAYDRALVADQGYDKAWVNLTRVEEVDEDSELEPFDVAATAERFVEDLRAWNESVPAS
jgi:tetratricopeptide (TPR) repeat protein